MALRNQPYIPLYVQDILTDEKLIECSAEAHGVYFRLLCLLHKQETYGLICLKQKHKQSESKYENFASMLRRQMPFSQVIIKEALKELTEEGVIQLTENKLGQKRMVKDGELSLIRSECGKKGGSNVTKQYGKQGYLYLMSNHRNRHKIGVSVNFQNRLYRIRSDFNLKVFDVVDTIFVLDMGKAEDKAQNYFKNIIDGEWINCDYETVKDTFALLKANLKAKDKANTENEYESENEVESNNKRLLAQQEKWFANIWKRYPKRDTKKQSWNHFRASVKTEKDWQNINKALENYLVAERVKNGYVQSAKTWFNNWPDWVEYKEPTTKKGRNDPYE